MSTPREIRADFDRDTIVVYQAYAPHIADPALAAQKFVPPFSFGRMTWIKPSFLWLMERSNWGQKSAQERTLAVRIRRAAWDNALRLAVLTSPDRKVWPDPAAWRTAIDASVVHVQWDPERSLRGAHLPHDSIQVGVSRHLIRQFAEEWITEIRDLSPLVAKIYTLIHAGESEKARCLLPPERIYPVTPDIASRLGM